MGRRGIPTPESEVPFFYAAESAPADSPAQMPSARASMEPEEEPVKRSLLRAGMTVLWMILLAAGYAWRACSPE